MHTLLYWPPVWYTSLAEHLANAFRFIHVLHITHHATQCLRVWSHLLVVT